MVDNITANEVLDAKGLSCPMKEGHEFLGIKEESDFIRFYIKKK